MKYAKGMWLDGRPSQNPPNTTRINKNVVLSKEYGSIVNEEGFLRGVSFNKRVIGISPLNKRDFFVLLQPDEIGVVNENGVYRSVYINANLALADIMDIEFFINNKGERIVVWNSVNGIPSTINIDIDNSTTSINQLSLTNYAHSAVLTTDVVEQGSLKSGAYYPVYAYERKDGSISNWFKNNNPVFITDDSKLYAVDNYDGIESGYFTNKAIVLNFIGLDTSYDFLRIGYVYSENKLMIASFVKRVAIPSVGVLNVRITGQEVNDVIDLSEVIVDTDIIKNFQHMTVNNNSLIVGDVKYFNEPSQQSKVNNLVLNWYSQITGLSLGFEDKYHAGNNKQRSFAHDEVYAIYIQFEYYWGYGQWFHCVNREATPDELIPDGIATDLKYYHVNDTCSIIGSHYIGTKGKFSYYENTNEPYPLNGEYPLGNVRHFKFPSLRWMRENVYNNTAYGTTTYDRLGIVVENLTLSDFTDCDGNPAISFRLGYAQRNNLNNRVIGQSIVNVNHNLTNQGSLLPDTINLVSVSGNYGYNSNGVDEFSASFATVSTTNYRLYPFEMLRTKVKTSPNYMKREFNLIGQYEYYKPGGDGVNVNNDEPITLLTDYLQGTSSLGNNNTVLLNLEKIAFVNNNVLDGEVNNLYLEEFVNVELNSFVGGMLNAEIFTGNTPLNNVTDGNYVGVEKTALATLLNIQPNYYSGFANQTVVNCGSDESPANIVFGGDTYICDYSITTYGVNKNKYTSDPADANTMNYKTNGLRAIKRFFVECQYNINLRFISQNSLFTEGTTYYPKKKKQALWNKNNTGFLQTISSDKNPNDFVNGYSDDYHTQNILGLYPIYNYLNEYNGHSPYRIARSDTNTEFKTNYWRTFKTNNKYDFVDRTKGRMTNLESTEEFLYIHFENTLYMTRPRSNFQTTDGRLVRVDVGDIFDVKPEELVNDKLGFLGTQHKSSCLMSPFGYIFYDAEKGKWWKVNKNIPEEISGEGLHNFFRDNNIAFDDRPFVSQGFTIVYDEKYERLIISKKYKKLPESLINKYKGVWRSDENFLNSLVKGDIVFKDGKYQMVN